MNIHLYFNWKQPAPTYITCRSSDIAAFKALGFVSEAYGPQHLAKITRPDSDLAGLISLVRQGATFHGNIESTSESGPALIAAHSGDLVIVACNDVFQPVIALLENGTMSGILGAKAYWHVAAGVKAVLGGRLSTVDCVQKSLYLDRDQWN